MDSTPPAPGAIPRSGLTKSQTRGNLDSFMLNTLLRGVFDATSGATGLVFSAFALALHVPGEEMGKLASIVAWACVVQMAGVLLTPQVRDKKRFVLTLGIFEPLVMIGAVLVVPFIRQEWRLTALGVSAFAAAAAVNLTKPLMEDWIASTVPPTLRGQFFGRRGQIATAVLIVITLSQGEVATYLRESSPIELGVVIAASGLFGVAAAMQLRKATLPALSAGASVDWTDVLETLRNKPFRRHIIATLITNAPFICAMPFYNVFALTVLNMSPRMVALALAISYVVKIPMLRFVGRHLARLGPRWVLRRVIWLYFVFFLLFPLSAWIGPPAYFIAWIIASIADAAWNVAWNSASYACIPSSRTRPAYFATLSLIVQGFVASGAWLGTLLLTRFHDLRWTVAGVTLNHYHLLYLGCAILMVPCAASTVMFAGRHAMKKR